MGSSDVQRFLPSLLWDLLRFTDAGMEEMRSVTGFLPRFYGPGS